MALTQEEFRHTLDVLDRTTPPQNHKIYPPEIRAFSSLAAVESISLSACGYPFTVYKFTAKDLAPGAPLFVNLHGGGWFIGYKPNDTYHGAWLAHQMHGIVLSADYSTSDIAPFDTMHEQCYAVLRFAFSNAEQWGADPEKISVGGYSAGGHLTAGVCLRAASSGEFAPFRQILCYSPLAFGKPKDKSFPEAPEEDRGAAFRTLLFRKEAEKYLPDPYANPFYAPDDLLAKLPPTLVITADFCHFTAEDNEFATRLALAHVDVTTHHFAGTSHGFIPHFYDRWEEASDLIVRTATGR